MFLFLPESSEAEPRPRVNVALATSIALVSVLLWGVGLDSALASTAFVLQRGADFNPSQLLGVAWVHLDLSHLVGNLLVLLALGNPLEARIGAGRYLALFLGSVLAGSLGSLLIGSHAALVGASGGVMGVALAFLVVCPLRHVRLALWIPALFALPIALLGVVGAPGLALLVFGVATLAWLVRSVLSCAEGQPPEGVILRSLGFRSVAFAGLWLVLLSLASDLAIAALGLSAVVDVGVWGHLGGAALGALLGLWWGREVAERGQERSLLQVLGLTPTPAPSLSGARVLAPFPESGPAERRRPSAGPLAERRPSFRPRVLQGGAAREARPTTGPLLRRPHQRPLLEGAPRRRQRPTQGQLARRPVARPDSFERWAAEQRRGG